MKKGVGFFGRYLSGGQGGRPCAILLVGEKHQHGRNIVDLSMHIRLVLLLFIIPFSIFSQGKIYPDYHLEITIEKVREKNCIDSIFVSITNLQTNKIDTFISETQEKIKVDLDSNSDYQIFAKCLKKQDSYTTFKNIISTKKIENSSTIFSTIKFDYVIIDSIFIINDVYYDHSSSNINNSGKVEIDKLVKWLMNSSTLEIEITSYIDCYEADKSLVEKRNQAVYNYIIKAGIASRQIHLSTLNGNDIYFCKKTNCSKEQQNLNRKTGFKILHF